MNKSQRGWLERAAGLGNIGGGGTEAAICQVLLDLDERLTIIETMAHAAQVNHKEAKRKAKARA